MSDVTTDTPFAQATITDPNSGETETVTVTLSAAANGKLIGSSGTYNATTGVYTVTGSASTVTQALDKLAFQPTARQEAVGKTIATGFTIKVTDTDGLTASNATASVVTTAAVSSPWTVTGATTVAGFRNDSTVTIGSGASLRVTSALDPASDGIFDLQTKGTLELNAILGNNLKIQFLGTKPANELIIDNAAQFGTHVGTASYAGPFLLGLAAGDVIDLKGLASSGLTASYSTGGLLQIERGSVATLDIPRPSSAAGTYNLASDGAGGTLITHS